MNPRLIMGLATLLMALYISYDAKKRGAKPYTAFIIGLLSFTLPIIVVPIYFLFRRALPFFPRKNASVHTQASQGTSSFCPKCGKDNSADVATCKHCGNQLRVTD